MMYRARFTWCYWHDQYRCECRLINRMIEGERCTVYPASSMVRIDRQLFGLVLSALSPVYVSAMMRGVERGQHKLSGLFEMQGMVCRHISLLVPLAEGMIETLWWSGQICDGHVLKIQAWWRRVVRDRQERRLALAMGLHARLGLASPLADLCDDHLRLILSA
jgi:hypothetical protein